MAKVLDREAAALEARLACSTMFRDDNPYLQIVPTTSNPGPLGFYSFAFCTILLCGILCEWVEPATATTVYAFAFTFAGLGQVIVGLLEYSRKNVFASNAFLCYGFFWLGTALNGTMQAVGLWQPTVKGAQMAYALWGCITMLFWLQTFVINMAVSLLFITLAILFFVLAAAQTNPGITKGAGAWGVVVSLIAFYVGTAILFIEMYGKVILPVGTFNWARMKKKFGPLGTLRRFNTDDDAPAPHDF